jgi:hypothetical protein
MAAIKKRDPFSHFLTLHGTPSDVRSKLADMKNQCIVAFAFEQGHERDASELVDVMNNIAPLFGAVKSQRQQSQIKAYQAIIEALIPSVPEPHHKIIEAKMTAHARSAVFASGDWLTAGQVAEMAGFSKTNPSAQPNKWKQNGAIFAVAHQGVDYFPSYALNPDAKYRPYKALADVIKVFGKKKDAWGLAYWFASVNSFLGGSRPQDLLANNPDQVIMAARDEVDELDGAAHG